MKDRFEIVAEGRNKVSILLDGETLFEKTGMFWQYVHYMDEQLTYEKIGNIDDSHLELFIDDIISQLESGIDRNDLTINVPKEVKTIRVGSVYHQIIK